MIIDNKTGIFNSFSALPVRHSLGDGGCAPSPLDRKLNLVYYPLHDPKGGRVLSACPMTASCTFFSEQMSDMPGMAKLIETQYCLADFGNCARFVVSSALGMGSVPGNLFPGHQEKARLLIADGSV